jgi:sugar lactone lactonase YvrE
MRMHRRQWISLAVFAAAAMLFPVSSRMSALSFPDLIQLPNNFGPEGIAVGNGGTFYVGSLANGPLGDTRGQILVGDLRTGLFSQLVAASGVPAIGMKHDPRTNLLYVARGPSGMGTVFDARTGEQVANYQLQTAASFINDVAVTRDAAYFTDSRAASIYRVALGPNGEPMSQVTEIPAPPGGNGIAATPSGAYLFLVNSGAGQLYRMDTATFTVSPVDLGGGDVLRADGLLLDGKTLYVVQNFLNRVAVVELSPDYVSGTITRFITEPFASNALTKVPTTIAAFGNALYAVTAGFAAPSPDFVVQLTK